jgi:hemerythrin-like domain-containing protein
MSFTNRVSQRLHEEHRATVALMERLEQLLARQRHGGVPDSGDPAVSLLLSELSAGLETEVRRHFDFEEDQLFTYLNDTGDEAIGALLTDEHRVIRPLGTEVAKLARAAAAQGFDEATWSKFRRPAQELCQRLLAHVEKEEMALLPLLQDSMDADTEARLLDEYLERI